SLKSADRVAYLRAIELLAPVGVPIEMAAAHFADAKQKLGNVPLSVAVDFYLRRHPLIQQSLQKVVDEMCDAKEIDGLSDCYVKALRYCLSHFAARFKGNISEVTGPEIDDWLRQSRWSPRSRNNMRRAIQTLFRFAR